MNARIITALFFIVVSLNLVSCGSDDQEPPQAKILRPVKTLTVSTQRAMNSREFTGVVDSEQKVDLAFRVSGTLQQLPVLEGKEVRKGQLLAALDPTDFEIQLRAVEADFARSRAEHERAKTLVERNLISKSEYEGLQAQYYVSEAELERARQELEYTHLYSPFTGFVAKKYVENLSEVTARSPILSLVDLNSLVVSIDVPESIMIKAQREGVRPELYAVFKGREDQQYPLAIKEIATQAEEGTQTYLVSLSLPLIPDLNILPGMSATVIARPFSMQGEDNDVVYLPGQSVLEDSVGRFVYVATPTSAQEATVERRTVEVGGISLFGIEILSGLQDGERVITAGMSQLSEGLQVRLTADK